MVGFELAAVVDPVAWCMAFLGALGFVGMALVAAIQCARHHNDGQAWAAERSELTGDLAAAQHLAAAQRTRIDSLLQLTQAAYDVDRALLARHHAAAAAEGLTAPPPAGLSNDPRWS